MSADRLEELSAGSLAGGLDAKERREFGKLMRAASPSDKASSASLFNTGAIAALCLPQVKPSAGLLQKMMPRIIKDSKAPDAKAPSESLKFVRGGGTAEWLSLPIPGVYFKLLSMDDSKDYVVVVGKLDPGASYPPHPHFAAEETYVLSGDLWIGDVKLVAGDFHIAAAGSQHGVNRSENGCEILHIISRRDFKAQLAGV
jgi:quercetin dioxygenase-like cupin family protein